MTSYSLVKTANLVYLILCRASGYIHWLYWGHRVTPQNRSTFVVAKQNTVSYLSCKDSMLTYFVNYSLK